MLLPYTYPTPKLALTRDGAFLFPQKTHSVWFISVLNYGDTENVLINHLLLVIPMSYPCHYTNLCPHKPHKLPTHTHTTHTHTHHTHTHTPHHTHTHHTDRQTDRHTHTHRQTHAHTQTDTHTTHTQQILFLEIVKNIFQSTFCNTQNLLHTILFQSSTQM